MWYLKESQYIHNLKRSREPLKVPVLDRRQLWSKTLTSQDSLRKIFVEGGTGVLEQL